MLVSPRTVRTVKAEADRRRIERVATNIDALWLDASETIPCRLLDVSPTGARLKFADPDRVPARFEIFVPDFQMCYLVDVKWRDGTSISVQFQKAWRETGCSA